MGEFVHAVHVGCAAVSIVGFVMRGTAMLLEVDWRRVGFLRVGPHLVDTVFLGSGIWLAASLGVSPIAQPWLAAKIAGLFCYIALGMIALRFGRTRALRGAAFCAALLAFAYIVGVALSRSTASWYSFW